MWPWVKLEGVAQPWAVFDLAMHHSLWVQSRYLRLRPPAAKRSYVGSSDAPKVSREHVLSPEGLESENRGSTRVVAPEFLEILNLETVNINNIIE